MSLLLHGHRNDVIGIVLQLLIIRFCLSLEAAVYEKKLRNAMSDVAKISQAPSSGRRGDLIRTVTALIGGWADAPRIPRNRDI